MINPIKWYLRYLETPPPPPTPKELAYANFFWVVFWVGLTVIVGVLLLAMCQGGYSS